MKYILTQSLDRPWITYQSLENLRSTFPKSTIYLWDDASTTLDLQRLRKSATVTIPLQTRMGIHALRYHQFVYMAAVVEDDDLVYLTDTDVIHDPLCSSLEAKLLSVPDTGAWGFFRTEIEDFHRLHLKRKVPDLVLKVYLPGCSILLRGRDIKLLAKHPVVGENWDWNMWPLLGSPTCVVPEESHVLHVGMGGLHSGGQLWRDRGENLTPWLKGWFQEHRAVLEQEASKMST